MPLLLGIGAVGSSAGYLIPAPRQEHVHPGGKLFVDIIALFSSISDLFKRSSAVFRAVADPSAALQVILSRDGLGQPGTLSCPGREIKAQFRTSLPLGTKCAGVMPVTFRISLMSVITSLR